VPVALDEEGAMYKRIVVPIYHYGRLDPALAFASEMATVTQRPLHLVGILDTRQFVHLGPHGPSVAIESFRRHSVTARAAIAEELRAIERALSDLGILVTHEVRQGIPEFELPSALRAGDLVVTTMDDCVQLGCDQRHSSSFEVLALPELSPEPTASAL
jgi:nucleotide-binding universal stress UspA family protein